MSLLPYFKAHCIECGCDEAGRGCLAGAVFAAAVILPPDFHCEELNDSKLLSERTRYILRTIIEQHALSWAVGVVSPEEIDRINILKASFTAMHLAIEKLTVKPEHLLIDGNRFLPYPGIPHTTIVKGDGKYLSIWLQGMNKESWFDFLQKKYFSSPHPHDGSGADPALYIPVLFPG